MQLEELKKLIKTISTSIDDFNLSLASGFVDFEDALQYFTAIGNNTDCIITRNKKDYTKSELPIYAPIDFINSFQL